MFFCCFSTPSLDPYQIGLEAMDFLLVSINIFFNDDNFHFKARLTASCP